jgi:hypothetical protein
MTLTAMPHCPDRAERGVNLRVSQSAGILRVRRLRNGIYRVWYKGSGVHGAAATLLVDGEFIACDQSHTYLGRYTDENGRFSAEVLCRRHTDLPPAPEIPDIDIFHMQLEGLSSGEGAIVICKVPEKPGFSLDVEYAWSCEI